MGRRTLRRSIIGSILVVFSLSANGCMGPTCNMDEGDAVPYTLGFTNAAGTYYESGANDDPFLHFPPGRTYQLHHKLLAAPPIWEARLAFSPCPFSEEISSGDTPRCAKINLSRNTGGATETAGNQVVWAALTDKVLQVRNETCAEFYLRIYASVPEGYAETTSAKDGSMGSSPDAADAGN